VSVFLLEHQKQVTILK